jgi:hypothetical protein
LKQILSVFKAVRKISDLFSSIVCDTAVLKYVASECTTAVPTKPQKSQRSLLLHKTAHSTTISIYQEEKEVIEKSKEDANINLHIQNIFK